MLPGNLNRAPGQPNRAPSSLNRAPGQPTVLQGNREHFNKESLHTGARARARPPRATDRRAPIENPIYSQGKLRTYKINLLGKTHKRTVLLHALELGAHGQPSTWSPRGKHVETEKPIALHDNQFALRFKFDSNITSVLRDSTNT